MEEPEEALAEDAECVVELDATADSEEAEGDSEEAEEEEEAEAAAAAAAVTAEAEVEFASEGEEEELEEEEEELLEDEETEERSWPVPVVIAGGLGWSAVCAFPWWWLKGDGERTPFDSLAVEVGRVGGLGG